MKQIQDIRNDLKIEFERRRKFLGWTYSRIARKTQIHKNTIYRFFNKEGATPSFAVAEKIADAMDMQLTVMYKD